MLCGWEGNRIGLTSHWPCIADHTGSRLHDDWEWAHLRTFFEVYRPFAICHCFAVVVSAGKYRRRADRTAWRLYETATVGGCDVMSHVITAADVGTAHAPAVTLLTSTDRMSGSVRSCVSWDNRPCGRRAYADVAGTSCDAQTAWRFGWTDVCSTVRGGVTRRLLRLRLWRRQSSSSAISRRRAVVRRSAFGSRVFASAGRQSAIRCLDIWVTLGATGGHDQFSPWVWNVLVPRTITSDADNPKFLDQD